MSETYNTLRSNGFTFNLLRLPDTAFRIVSIEFPEVNLQPVNSPLPGAIAYIPGQTFEFGDFIIRFVVDEDLKNYMEIFNWLTQQQIATTFSSIDPKEELLVSDGVLTMLNNSSVANKTFTFSDMFPISLSGFQLSTATSAPEQIECSATFKFSKFTLNS